MAGISSSAAITAILKTWYKDGVENLLFRNSPVLRKLNKTRVEGKEQAFAAMYGRGGAVGANFTTAKTQAQTTARNVEFRVVPGQLFSVYTMNSKEVQASLSKRGAYMKVAGNKMFASSEAFRKTLAAALYGRGYGELAAYTVGGSNLSITTSGTAIVLPVDAIMKLDIGSRIIFKATIAASSGTGVCEVTAINGTSVTVKSTTGSAISLTASTTYIVCLDGSLDAAGKDNLPMGLDGWLPIVAGRTGNTWSTYIGADFFGVDRSIAADRLAGQFAVESSSSAPKNAVVEQLLMQCRRAGSQADLIVMNDEDWKAVADAIYASNTYFTQTSTKGKRVANAGTSEISASFSTNYIENVYDDPYCPKGKFYILDTAAVELWSYTNADKIADGIVDNNAGKADVMTADNDGKENSPYGLIIDDYLNVQPGSGSIDGPDMDVTLQFFGSFVVTNPSVCGVGIFYSASHADLIGYTA